MKDSLKKSLSAPELLDRARRYCAMSEEKEERWIKNLSERMRAFNGLIVDYYGGYLPEILQVTGPRSVDRRQVLTPYFYD